MIIMSKSKSQTLKLTLTAALTALATVIYMIFPEIPLVPGVEYLKIDFSDIPAILTGILIGPFWGALCEIVKNIIHLTRTSTFGIGELMNIGIGSGLILSLTGFSKLFSRIFSKKKLSPSIYFSAGICAVAATVLTGWLFNGILTPTYYALMGFPITTASVIAGVWGSTLLNAVKAALNVFPFYPVYAAAYKSFSKIA